MQGASPLASPGMNPSGTGCPCRTGTLAEGLSGWLPARPATAVPNGSACRLCRLSTLPLALAAAPIPPPPSPAGKGEIKVIFMQGASPLASPALDRLRRLQSQRNRHSGGRRIPETALTVSAHPVEFFPGSRHEPRFLRSYIREKFWGGLGDSFKSPPALLLSRGSSDHSFKKSSGGSGGLFQESPGAAP